MRCRGASTQTQLAIRCVLRPPSILAQSSQHVSVRHGRNLRARHVGLVMPLLVMDVDGRHQGKRKRNHSFAGHRIVAVATVDNLLWICASQHRLGKIQRSALAGMRIQT